MRFLTEQLPSVLGIYLFGSRADGSARADSDYDIAFLLPAPADSPEPYALFSMAVELGEHLGQTVDHIDLHQTQTDFRFQIISTAQRIHCADRTACDTFEMITYSMSQRFEEERKDIVEAVKKRGSIYG
ncbi:MAG: type VII toxin-antitoxin system MntA family adenylyltransferase antitoxin [Saprospiraceae bacterium]